MLVAAAFAIAAFVRLQIQNSEFRIELEPQRISLVNEVIEEEEIEEIEIEEEIIEEVVDVPEPIEDQPDLSAPPSSDLLGLDSAASSGIDAFGLLARRGGRELLASGSGNAGCDWYMTVLNGELNDHLVSTLSRHEVLLRKEYSVSLRLWLEDDGHIERFEVSSTGDKELDRELSAALKEFRKVSPPPPDLPQPVRISLSCHMTGLF